MPLLLAMYLPHRCEAQRPSRCASSKEPAPLPGFFWPPFFAQPKQVRWDPTCIFASLVGLSNNCGTDRQTREVTIGNVSVHEKGLRGATWLGASKRGTKNRSGEREVQVTRAGHTPLLHG